MVLTAALCFSSMTGCRGHSELAPSNESAPYSDGSDASGASIEDSGNGKDSSGSGNGKDGNATDATDSDSEETEDTREDAGATTSESTTRAPLVLDGDVQLPDDAVIKGLTASIVGGQDMSVSLRTDGKYHQANNTTMMASAQQFFLAYTVSHEFYEEMMRTSDQQDSMTYEEYLDMMFEDGILNRNDFDENYNLKDLPDDRVFFSLSTHIDPKINRSSADFQKQISESIRHAMESFFSDTECYSSIEKLLKETKVLFDLPIFYNININMPLEGCLYVELDASSLDGSRQFRVVESIMGADKLSATYKKDMVLRHWTAEKVMVGSPLADKSVAEQLNQELQDFRSKCDVTLRFPDPWTKTNALDYSGNRDPEHVFRLETGMYDGAYYCYLGDGRWYYGSELSTGEYLTAKDPADNEHMLEACYDRLANVILMHRDDSNPVLRNTWKQDPSKSYTTSRLQPQSPTPNCSSLILFDSDNSHKTYYIEMENNNLVYEEAKSVLQIAASNGSPALYNDESFYEYIRVGKETFYRHDTTDVYYPDGDFEGSKQPEIFELSLQKNYSFVGGCELDMTPHSDLGYNESQLQGFCCETYKSKDGAEMLKVILDGEGHPVGGWSLNGTEFTIYLCISERAQQNDFDYVIEHARTHTKEAADKKEEESKIPDDEWIVKDALADGFPDLSGDIQKGEVFGGSQVVINYILHFRDHKPFYIKQYTYGNFRREEAEITSDSNLDFCESEKVSYHNNNSGYDLTTIKIGDTVYITGKDMKTITGSASDYSDDEIYYRFPEALNPVKHAGCLEAYRGTLNGKEYIIEVWECKQQKYTFFCDEEKILAVSYTEFGKPMCTYFRDFDTKAKSSLIKKPA